jgi:Cu2+-exporting ATPase
MIFLGLEVLASTYVVMRIVEKKRKNSLAIQSKNDQEKQANHYLKVNLLSFVFLLLSNISSVSLLVGLYLISYSSVPILRKSEKSLFQEKRVKNDTLNSMVTIISIGMGKYYIATLVAGLYHFGDKMVIKTQDHSKTMLHDIFNQQLSKVVLLTPQGVETDVSIKTIKAGNIIVVYAGNMIPVDGYIIEGAAMIDQHMLTGESMLVEKTIGDQVFSSTLLTSGKIFIQVQYSGNDTNAAQICNILENTSEHKTAIQLYSEKLADKVAIPLICLSTIALPVVGVLPALTILYSSPGNSIKTFASLQTFSYLIHLSKQNILVKDGRALETLLKVDTVLFDKTGTLTEEQPTIGEIIDCHDLSVREILTYAATAEYRLSHPIAKAIFKHAESKGLKIKPVKKVHYELGYGIKVKIDSDIIKVGSLRFLEMENIIIPNSIKEIESNWHKKGYSIIALAKNKHLQGVIQIKPKLRPGIENMLRCLRDQGIEYLGIVSGDQKEPTQNLAKKLEMDTYFHDVLPQDKAAIVEKLQQQGRTVCFIGDGINDTIAMKKSNVSVSFSDASAVTSNLAQIVLTKNNITDLPTLFKTAENSHSDTQKIVKSLGGTATFQVISAGLLGMTVVGAIILQVAVNSIGFSYTMRSLKK